ncbi:CDP-glucose 4,6-dehydratase [Leptospira gomenensis]|uniref:CDP-glucose 4,6-dehydratase n=2 Tax=Leptospira gomenensis TaxID=2484974 RepID=UPI001FE56186|nr:CDP-glucose 4,6-dehydratase [Leptospira gomenensis]
MFNQVYKGKKILITGNTGFKGSWLSSWLVRLGAASIRGYSSNIPTEPSIFQGSDLLKKGTDQIWGDVRDRSSLSDAIQLYRPDFIFHLAAQALVKTSYSNPLETIETNAMGTANVLDVVRNLNYPCTVVLITSDKVYENVEWYYGYRENDRLGGYDPYSASKSAAEILINAYLKSFLLNNPYVKIGIGRAGNVIGGGDWAPDRIVPDAIRAWSEEKSLQVRNPFATRPWQHVMEPLSGYLRVGQALFEGKILTGESFNFGPPGEQNATVAELLDRMKPYWKNSSWTDTSAGNKSYEAGLLKLSCDKALQILQWKPNLELSNTIRFTMEWYLEYYNRNTVPDELMQNQIEEYETIAKNSKIAWAID